MAVSICYGQSDRGTITGTISDPTKAVIPGASVVAKNGDTGVTYQTVSTETGNYTLGQLPAGHPDDRPRVGLHGGLNRRARPIAPAERFRSDLQPVA